MLSQWSQIKIVIQNSKSCLLAAHIHPDLDAFNALSAMSSYITSHAITVHICFDGLPPEGTHESELHHRVPIADLLQDPAADYDALVLLDTAVTHQLGSAEFIIGQFKMQSKPIINIDHHHVNPGFGDINIVDGQAAATCELIFELFKLDEFAISKELAHILLQGIYGDTDLLRTQSVTSRTLRTAAELIDLSADRMRIIEECASLDVDRARLWAHVLIGLRQPENAPHIAYAVADASLIGADGAGEPLIEGVANYMRDLKGIDLAILFIQRKDGIKLSFRSTSNISALDFARQFGGGGHQTRAGCDFPGEEMNDVVQLVLAKLAEMQT